MILLCRLAAYREKVRERAKAVDAEDAKQRLRGQVMGKRVEGPDVNAFMRQLAEVRFSGFSLILTYLTNTSLA